MSIIYFVSSVYSTILSVAHIVPYDNTIMTRNGYGLIEGTVTVIMEGLRKSRQTFVRAADRQIYRINSRILSSVNFMIKMIKILDIRFSPRTEYTKFPLGQFPGVWFIIADVGDYKPHAGELP